MDAQDKIKKSAEALGVVLQIPAFVDPNTGFMTDKVITWENGDQIKVNVIWAEGVFNYYATLGQIDPKTNELSFISGPIAQAQSLESLIDQVNVFEVSHAPEREAKVDATQETPVDVPTGEHADEPISVEGEPVDVPVGGPDGTEEIDTIIGPEPEEIEIDDDVINAYQALNQEYQQLLIDPDHDHDKVWEMSNKLKDLEYKLREQGVKPGDLLI